MKIKNILIVGGNGKIGKILAEYLRLKFNVFIIDKKKSKNNYKKNIKFIKYNLLTKKEIQIKNKIDIVLFLAGYTGGPESSHLKNFKTYMDFNCEILINFLERTKNLKIKKLVFASTEHVYGDQEKRVYKTDITEPMPKNYYGVSKLFAEKILYDFCIKTSVSVDILRFPRVIFDDDNNLISTMIKDAISKRKIILKDTNTKFNFLHIKDLLKAFTTCLIAKDSGFRIFNVFNNSEPLGLNDIAKYIKKKIDNVKIVKFKNNNNQTHNPKYLKLNISFTKKKLKWKPLFNNIKIINELIKKHEIKEYN